MTFPDCDTTGMTCSRKRDGIRCAEPSVARRGVRCATGCMGEGLFEGCCPKHRGHIDVVDAVSARCNGCRKVGVITFFPIQELTRSET